MDIVELLGAMVISQASDLFISVDSPPLIKIEGKLKPAIDERLSSEQNSALIYSILNEEEIVEFKSCFELNKALKLDRIGRFRVNVFQQNGEPAMVIRYIKKIIPSIESLGLPLSLKDIINQERGLVLIVGSTGCGKSTTLASMIDYRNTTQSGHILTIEDPIEFIHKNKNSLINQREVGMDTQSYEIALKNAMRESPDVILIGEIRDSNTMQQAITYAETGHLCLATMHASNANLALERIINFFPREAHKLVLQDLALNLNAIVAQRLCIGAEQVRIAAVELMIATPFISKLIEQGRIDEIKEAMTRSKGRINQTFDEALYQLVKQQKISKKEALRRADSTNNLALRFRLEDRNKQESDSPDQEYIINRTAPFDHYCTFNVVPLTVQSKNTNIKKMLNLSLTHFFNSRGLEFSANNSDIEVQYLLGLKVDEGLSLEPIEGQNSNLEYYIPTTREHALLMVNILDNHTRKPIFRITAIRKATDFNEQQHLLDESIATLLKGYPAENHI